MFGIKNNNLLKNEFKTRTKLINLLQKYILAFLKQFKLF